MRVDTGGAEARQQDGFMPTGWLANRQGLGAVAGEEGCKVSRMIGDILTAAGGAVEDGDGVLGNVAAEKAAVGVLGGGQHHVILCALGIVCGRGCPNNSSSDGKQAAVTTMTSGANPWSARSAATASLDLARSRLASAPLAPIQQE